MRRLLSFSVFILFFIAGLKLVEARRYRDVFESICDLTSDYFYKDNRRLREWVLECRHEARHLPLTTSLSRLLYLMQEKMSELAVSHFLVYTPAEDRKLWKGETVDTGIRARLIDDHLVVFKVLPTSSAERAGVTVGDEIVGLPGPSEQVTAWGAEHRAGEFKLRRAGKPLALTLEPSPLTIDSSPELLDLDGGRSGLLVISSFRSEFFSKPAWMKLAARLPRFRQLVVDVRENAGGNFVAMLRALSPFLCAPTTIGHLLQPRKAAPDKPAFDDETDDQYQIKELAMYHRIGLQTFPGYPCFRGRATVLTSSDTSSVAEIFADAFKFRANSRVWGQPTAGDVILAVWYDLPLLGPGYSVSVPEADYLNSAGKEIEGEGVFPQKDLFYDLELSLAGKDSWIVEALKH